MKNEKNISFYCIFYILFIFYKFFNLFSIILLLLGIYTADFLSGIVHILLDNPDFLNEDHLNASKKLIPASKLKLNFFQKICYLFQMHHVNIKNINGVSIYDDSIMGLALQILFLPFLFINFIFYKFSLSHNLLIYIDSIILAGLHAQYFHQISHENKYKFLQKYKLIILSKEHNKHHIFPHDKNFCIMTGWANPLLNFLYKKYKRM